MTSIPLTDHIRKLTRVYIFAEDINRLLKTDSIKEALSAFKLNSKVGLMELRMFSPLLFKRVLNSDFTILCANIKVRIFKAKIITINSIEI